MPLDLYYNEGAVWRWFLLRTFYMPL